MEGTAWRRIGLPDALELRGVCRNFPGFSLADVSCAIKTGSVMGLLDPNGAGKTTTIKLILGLMCLHAGSISILGRDFLGHEVEARRQIGYVAEAAQLPPHASTRWLEEVLSACYPTWDGVLYRQYLGKLKVPPDKPARELSKGTVVKLALAGALAHRPRLLILDEPTSGLDPIVRFEVVSLVSELATKGSMSALFSTHIVSDLEEAADDVTVLCDGRVVASEAKEHLLARWRRLTFPTGEAGWQALQETAPEDFLDVRTEGGVTRAVTGSYSPELIGRLQRVTGEGLRVEELGLEEVFRHLVNSGEAGQLRRM